MIFALNQGFAPAEGYTKLYVIGASSVDAGNFNNHPDPGFKPLYLPDPPYYKDRFTNGPSYADWLNYALFREFLSPSIKGGTSYAFGGAIPGYSAKVPYFPSSVPTYLEQKEQLLADVGGRLDAGALIFIQGGGNALAANAVIEDPLPMEAIGILGAQAYIDIIRDLINAGAKNIIIAPSPHIKPYLNLNSFRDVNIIEFSVENVIARIKNAPDFWGIEEINRSCAVLILPHARDENGDRARTYDRNQPENMWKGEYPASGFCDFPNRHLMLDGFHYSAIVHEVIGRALVKTVIRQSQ